MTVRPFERYHVATVPGFVTKLGVTSVEIFEAIEARTAATASDDPDAEELREHLTLYEAMEEVLDRQRTDTYIFDAPEEESHGFDVYEILKEDPPRTDRTEVFALLRSIAETPQFSGVVEEISLNRPDAGPGGCISLRSEAFTTDVAEGVREQISNGQLSSVMDWNVQEDEDTVRLSWGGA